MANQPHVTEEITLTAHPMDAWRTALDALIACAPGDVVAIAWHLADANRQLMTREPRRAPAPISASQAKEAVRIRARVMAEFALNEVHQHQAREQARTGRRGIRMEHPNCPGCNHSPALLRLAGGVVPHLAPCPLAELDDLGFTRQAPWIGIDPAAAGSREQQTTGRPGTASSGGHEAQTPPHSNAPTTTIALSTQAQASPGLLVQQLCEARREPEHESALRSAAGESLLRPSGGSSCQ